MTALAVVDILGTVLSLITWGIDRFPEQPPKNSLLRVALGLNDGEVQNAGGLSPNVWAYDALENQIGRTADPWIGRPIIDDGNFDDITIFHKADKERTQSRYINVEADVSGDLICIAYMTLTWADSGKHGWNGDLGKICDQPWYPSNVVIGGDDYEPACTWFGYGHSRFASGVYLDMVAVGPESEDAVKDTDYYCQKQDYYHTGNTRHRRHQSLSSRSHDAFSSMLVISGSDKHNGTSNELCTSITSYGPSFVSTAEHAFCDMETKTLWPLCDDSPSDIGSCFDLDTHSLLGVGKLHRRSYKFTTVHHWD